MNLEARHLEPISVEDYLSGEELAKRRHEYVDGMVYAMTGGTYSHALIGSRVLVALANQLQGGPCVVLGSDCKVHVSAGPGNWFYYPDVTVVCGENILEAVCQDKPTVIVEIFSRSTRRTDEGEKWTAYRRLDSLKTYIMFEQESSAAIVYQRTSDGFSRAVYKGLEAVILLPELKASLALADVYANVKFVREPDEDYAFELNET